MRTAVVCIAKNEDLYIDEWVEHNLKIGFDHVFVYQNNWRYTIEHPQVTTIPFDGEEQQTPAYNHFITNHKNDFDWVAFFDVDEFITPKKHNNIKELLTNYNNHQGLGINWVMFGDNNITYNPNNNSVIQRFTKRQQGVNQHIKTIVNLKHNSNVKFRNGHNINKTIIDPNYNRISGPFNKIGNDDIVQLNHYWTKTFEEFKLKCEKGRVDTIREDLQRTLEQFKPFQENNNSIEDLTLLNFTYRVIQD